MVRKKLPHTNDSLEQKKTKRKNKTAQNDTYLADKHTNDINHPST